MDSLTSLTSFVRTAETLSFVQAARLLGISASAVGKNVARLEHKLGVRLFNRSTRNVSLTAEGAAFLTRCQSILEQIQEAESELTSSLSQPSGKLRISLPVIGYRLLLPALTAFSRLYPQVELDLDFSDRLVNLIDEGFDIAIRSGELADSRLIARKLGVFVLCSAPARHIWRNTAFPARQRNWRRTSAFFSLPFDGADPALGTARYAADGGFQGRFRDEGQ